MRRQLWIVTVAWGSAFAATSQANDGVHTFVDLQPFANQMKDADFFPGDYQGDLRALKLRYARFSNVLVTRRVSEGAERARFFPR